MFSHHLPTKTSKLNGSNRHLTQTNLHPRRCSADGCSSLHIVVQGYHKGVSDVPSTFLYDVRFQSNWASSFPNFRILVYFSYTKCLKSTCLYAAYCPGVTSQNASSYFVQQWKVQSGAFASGVFLRLLIGELGKCLLHGASYLHQRWLKHVIPHNDVPFRDLNDVPLSFWSHSPQKTEILVPRTAFSSMIAFFVQPTPRSYIAECFRLFHVVVEGPKGCLLLSAFSCNFWQGIFEVLNPQNFPNFAYWKCLYNNIGLHNATAWCIRSGPKTAQNASFGASIYLLEMGTMFPKVWESKSSTAEILLP